MSIYNDRKTELQDFVNQLPADTNNMTADQLDELGTLLGKIGGLGQYLSNECHHDANFIRETE